MGAGRASGNKSIKSTGTALLDESAKSQRAGNGRESYLDKSRIRRRTRGEGSFSQCSCPLKTVGRRGVAARRPGEGSFSQCSCPVSAGLPAR